MLTYSLIMKNFIDHLKQNNDHLTGLGAIIAFVVTSILLVMFKTYVSAVGCLFIWGIVLFLVGIFLHIFSKKQPNETLSP